ncbi:hypothetical protein HELRODRAFT_109972 [Helobdella robusta]|uniref:rhomboid protease n=1 Tax=Helobdella robusta TaxID=6412 RepID=T1EEY0_HELRO|nr:hypothetical protein HELRODRAFT_109972 [Helobdella robusta]ESO08983.1 hypothetical protein HELRODRAFT_109972 [Helobdella robusta]
MRVVSKELTNFQRLLRTAVSSVVPSKQLPTGETYVDHYFQYYSCCPPPLFMITVSIIELVIFIVYAKIQKTETSWTTGAPLYSPLTYNPFRRYEAWRFISYMFIHDGIMHILSNLIFQLIIGLPLELFHKFWRVGIVYVLGVIAGSLATSIFDNKTYLVGASGGCYALIGAHFATIIMNWKNMTHDWMSGPLKFIFTSVDIGVAIWSRYNNPNRVAYAAHFAGLAAGVLIGVPVLRNIEVLRWEKILFWVCLALYLLLVLFSICWNGFYPDFPPTDWRPCCPGA